MATVLAAEGAETHRVEEFNKDGETPFVRAYVATSAESLAVSPTTLWRKLKRYGL